jgi:hypothetical protein
VLAVATGDARLVDVADDVRWELASFVEVGEAGTDELEAPAKRDDGREPDNPYFGGLA